MSGMAELLNNLGHIITGSDLSDLKTEFKY